MVDIDRICNELSSQCSVRRHDALEQLRLSLLSSGSIGHDDETELLSRLRLCLSDAHWSIVHQTLQLLDALINSSGGCGGGGGGGGSTAWASMVPLLPAMVACVGHEKALVRRAALRVLSSLSESAPVIEAVVRYGFCHESKRVRCEAMLSITKLRIPAETASEHQQQHHQHQHQQQLVLVLVLENMVENLRDRDADVVKAAQTALALVWHRYHSQVPNALKKLKLDSLRELRENMPQVKQCAQETLSNDDELQFGFVVSSVFERAQRTDYRVRMSAIEEIQQSLGALDDVRELLPHLREFIEFLIDTLRDSNFKIQLTTLQIIGDLVSKVGGNVVSHLGALIPCLIQRFGDNKIVIRQVTRRLFVQLLESVPLQAAVVPALQQALNEASSNVREASLHLLVYAVLRAQDALATVDLRRLSRALRGAVAHDTKDGNRALALEALALIAHKHGAQFVLDSHRNRNNNDDDDDDEENEDEDEDEEAQTRMQIVERLRHAQLPRRAPDAEQLIVYPFLRCQREEAEGAGGCSVGEELGHRRHPSAGSRASSKVPFLNQQQAQPQQQQQQRRRTTTPGRTPSDTAPTPPRLEFSGNTIPSAAVAASMPSGPSLTSRRAPSTLTTTATTAAEPSSQMIASKLKSLKSKAGRGYSPGRRAYSANVVRPTSSLAATAPELLNLAALGGGRGDRRVSLQNQQHQQQQQQQRTPRRQQSFDSRRPSYAPRSCRSSDSTPSHPSSAPPAAAAAAAMATASASRKSSWRTSRSAGSGAPPPPLVQGSERSLEGVSCSTQYLSASELQPLSDAQRSLEIVQKALPSTASWKEQFAALDSLRRLCVHHPAIVAPQLASLSGALRAPLHSLRSSLARNALLTVNELLQHCGTSIDKASLRTIVPALIRRSCETNEFLVAEATKALQTLARAVPSKTAVPTLLDHASKSPNERAQVLLSLEACVSSAIHKGTSLHVGIGSLNYSRLVKLVATRLEEGSISIRNAAKRLSAALELQSGQVFWNAARACLSARVIEMMQGVIAKEALAVTSLQGGLMSPPPPSSSSSLSSSPQKRESRRSSRNSPKAFNDSLRVDNECASNQSTNAAVESTGATLRIPEGINSDLSSSEWRRRLQGIERVRRLVADQREQLSELNLQSVVECLAPRLTDSNSKVNVFALEALQNIVTFTKQSSMRSSMSVLVPPLGACMASSHANVRRIASDVVDSLMLAESDAMRAELLLQMCQVASFGNSRVMSAAFGKLVSLVDSSAFESSATSRSLPVIVKHVVPLALTQIDNGKGEVQRANRQLLHALHTRLGTTLLDHANRSAMSHRKIEKLRNILSSS